MTLDSISKGRALTLPTKVYIVKVKAMVFSVVMYGYERWTIKKAERQRIDAFKLGYWRRLLRVPWTARRSNCQVSVVYAPRSFVSSQQKFGVRDTKAPWWVTGLGGLTVL